MTTIAQSIAQRHIEERKRSKTGDVKRSGSAILEGLLLFLATPFLGLAYVIAYGFIGIIAIFCYGLKAFGIECGVFKK